MKGLILKDLMSLKSQFKFVVIFIILYGCLAVFMNNSAFFGFLVIFISIFVPIAALAYDEKTNWDRYAMALPVNRSTIIASKYILSYGISVIASVLYLIYALCLDTEETFVTFTVFLVYLTLAIVIMNVIMPVMLRFGVQKGRIAIFIVVFVPVFGSFLLSKSENIVNWAKNSVTNIFNSGLQMIILPIIIVISSIISILISLRVFKNKEF